MATDERQERARRVMAGLRSGLPFDRIFPAAAPREERPPAPFADHHLDIVAGNAASPHGGTMTRRYLLECEHATGELSLVISDGLDADSLEDMERMDAAALDGILANHRNRTGCQCWPKGWARVEVA